MSTIFELLLAWIAVSMILTPVLCAVLFGRAK
jgi:hypothetical protein